MWCCRAATWAGAGPVPPSQAPTPNQITIGQMYVQFQVPLRKKGMPPVIMVHGSSHTAACLESTPDGREGWAPYFVRQGISTYIVDQAGRGRSGFDESVIHEAAATVRNGDVVNGTARIPGFGRITDNGAWTAWFGHLIPTGSTILTGTLIRHGDPGDPPDDDANHTDDYTPAFPFGAVDPEIVSRAGAIAQDHACRAFHAFHGESKSCQALQLPQALIQSQWRQVMIEQLHIAVVRIQ